MALNTLKCNHLRLTPLHFKGLIIMHYKIIIFGEREHFTNRFGDCYLPSKLSYFNTYFYIVSIYSVLSIDVFSCMFMLFCRVTTGLKLRLTYLLTFLCYVCLFAPFILFWVIFALNLRFPYLLLLLICFVCTIFGYFRAVLLLRLFLRHRNSRRTFFVISIYDIF